MEFIYGNYIQNVHDAHKANQELLLGRARARAWTQDCPGGPGPGPVRARSQAQLVINPVINPGPISNQQLVINQTSNTIPRSTQIPKPIQSSTPLLYRMETYSIFSLLRSPLFRRFPHGDLSNFDKILTTSVNNDKIHVEASQGRHVVFFLSLYISKNGPYLSVSRVS